MILYREHGFTIVRLEPYCVVLLLGCDVSDVSDVINVSNVSNVSNVTTFSIYG